ncbi:MAG: adenylosuccinate lyase, partial [Pseudomonadota bacterium]|nr:adenylosuccinate lyase [Pseudomonadota bacterium]
MEQSPLTAVSPLDGRYAAKCAPLRDLFSEQGLIRLRALVQVRWVQFLAEQNEFAGLGPFSPSVGECLNALVDEFSVDDARRIKAIEATTNHDVKAVEYFLA